MLGKTGKTQCTEMPPAAKTSVAELDFQMELREKSNVEIYLKLECPRIKFNVQIF